MMKLTLALVAALTLSGCAYSPKSTTIAPEIQTAESVIGKGAEIVLTVKDRRDDEPIGFRSDAYGNTDVIKTAQNIEAVVYDALSDTFVARGFSVVSPRQKSSKNSLTVEIRQLENNSDGNVLTSKIRTEVTLQAIASNGRTNYESSYRAHKDGRDVATSSASRNERYINETLSRALNDLANDEKLVRLFVASP